MSKMRICSFLLSSWFYWFKVHHVTLVSSEFFSPAFVSMHLTAVLNFLIHIPVHAISVLWAGRSCDWALTEQTRHAPSSGLQYLQFWQMSTFFIRSFNIVRQNSSFLKYTNTSIKYNNNISVLWYMLYIRPVLIGHFIHIFKYMYLLHLNIFLTNKKNASSILIFF